MLFKIGDKVSWISQAQGSAKEKRGVVIAALPSTRSSHLGARVTTERSTFYKRRVADVTYLDLGDLGEFMVSKYMGQSTSLVDRYLVAVPRRLKNGKLSGSVDIYTPTQAVLQKNGAIIEAL